MNPTGSLYLRTAILDFRNVPAYLAAAATAIRRNGRPESGCPDKRWVSLKEPGLEVSIWLVPLSRISFTFT
jgi:hypothetical protein